MWIFSSNSFISIVQKPGDTDLLTVRARIKAKVEENKGTDYKFRAKVAREVVAKTLHDQAMSLAYPNFKSTVKNRKRHDAYMDVWSAMYKVQG